MPLEPLSLFEAAKVVVEVVWDWFPPHVRNRLRAKAGEFLPLSMIPTNHDLLRAVRIAWVNATIHTVDAVSKEARKAPRGDASAAQVLTFCEALNKTVRALRYDDFNRGELPRQSPIDPHIEQILGTAGKWIAGLEKPGSEAPISAAFGDATAALTGVSRELVPAALILAAEQGIGDHLRSFGTLLFDELGELLKGEHYKEAKEAFQIRLMGLMQAQLERLEIKIEEVPDRVAEKLNRDVVPGLASEVASRVGLSVEQATGTLMNGVRQIVAEEVARGQGQAIDPGIVQQRFDALVVTLLEAKERRASDDVVDEKLERMRMLAAKGEAERAAEMFVETYRAFERDARHARDEMADRGLRLLKLGINQAVAAGSQRLAAERVIAAALLKGGATAEGQFVALSEAKSEWEISSTLFNRFVVWRIGEAMDKRGFNATNAFDGAVAAGRGLIDLEFGYTPSAWLTEAVRILLRQTRAKAVRALVAELRESGRAREIEAALAKLETYANEVDAAPNRPIETAEAWELQAAALAWPGATTAQVSVGPMRRVFDHMTTLVLSRGIRVSPLPPVVLHAIQGNGVGRTPYATPFWVAFGSPTGAAAAEPMRREGLRRKTWGKGDAATGIGRLEYALTLSSTVPAKAVADVHAALSNAYRDRFSWEGDAVFLEKAVRHMGPAAEYYIRYEPDGALASIYQRAYEQLGEILRIATGQAPPAPGSQKQTWF